MPTYNVEPFSDNAKFDVNITDLYMNTIMGKFKMNDINLKSVNKEVAGAFMFLCDLYDIHGSITYIESPQDDGWKNIDVEKPNDGEMVLITNQQKKHFSVGWWADDWKCWCYVGSRDIIEFSIPMKLWKKII